MIVLHNQLGSLFGKPLHGSILWTPLSSSSIIVDNIFQGTPIAGQRSKFVKLRRRRRLHRYEQTGWEPMSARTISAPRKYHSTVDWNGTTRIQGTS